VAWNFPRALGKSMSLGVAFCRLQREGERRLLHSVRDSPGEKKKRRRLQSEVEEHYTRISEGGKGRGERGAKLRAHRIGLGRRQSCLACKCRTKGVLLSPSSPAEGKKGCWRASPSACAEKQRRRRCTGRFSQPPC